MSSHELADPTTADSAECLLASNDEARLLARLGNAAFIALQCEQCNATAIISLAEESSKAKIAVISGICHTDNLSPGF